MHLNIRFNVALMRNVRTYKCLRTFQSRTETQDASCVEGYNNLLLTLNNAHSYQPY